MQPTRLIGDRQALGKAHGQRHREQIHDSLAVYARLFEDFAGIDWTRARREAQRFLPAVERHFPAILDEIAGIAAGAGVEYEDVLALNCRSELALTQAGGCSAFSLKRDGQWLAQTWDWRGDQQRNVVALEIHGDEAAPLISVGEAGMVGKIGFNAHGLGVGLNAIRSRTCGDGLPIHVALRKVLECPDFAAARRVVDEDRVASPAHFLIASATGEAAGFEVHPGRPGELRPRDGKVAHTNHLCADIGIEDFPRPDSPQRLARLEALLENPVPAESEALFNLLSDHDGAPASICRHTDLSQPESERMETLFAVVMDLDARWLELRLGKPCQPQAQLTLTLASETGARGGAA